MLIVYIGRKPSKADNVAGTGLVWTPGQSHEVTDPLACAKLLKHSDAWHQVAENPPARSLGLPQADQEVADLRSALDAKGIKYHHKAGAEKLRALLQGAAQ